MSTILLIDLSSILHPLWHTTQGSTNPNECSIQTVARVRALASGQPHVAVCCDSGRSFRRDISSDYKANRPERDATLAHQMTLAIETLKGDGFPVWAVAGFEADDLLATAVSMLTTPRMVHLVDPDGSTQHRVVPQDDVAITLATSDKDMFQLVSDRVTVHRVSDTKKALLVTPDVVQAEYGITPNQMRDYLCLVGDASDNIKGAEGIGPKKAAAMLARYGNLEDLYAALDAGEAFQSSTVKALTEFRGRMEIVRALVTLRTDVPLPFEDVFKERVPADVAVFGEEHIKEQNNADGLSGPGSTGDGGRSMEISQPSGERNGSGISGSTSGPRSAEGSNRSTGDSDRQGMGPMDTSTEPRHAEAEPIAAPVDPMAKLAQDTPKQEIVRPAPTSQGLMVPEVLPPPSQQFEMQLEPRSTNQAIELAKHMHASRLFSAYGTPQAVLSTIMAGREIGLQAMASLRAFHIIDGKQAQSADLIRAQCLRSPLCEYFRIVERSATKATWVTKRKGDPEVTLTYTIEEGRQAWQKDQKAWDASAWGKRPANMVTKTAAATIARLVYPDLVLNMYCPEELSGEEVS